MKIERKRYVVMRKNRTEIWGGLAQHYRFRPISDIGEFAIKTYRTEKQAHTCSSWDRDFEVVEVNETLVSTDHQNEQSEDMVDINAVKKWLYEIAINNVGCVIEGDFSNACEEIISRLDGLKRFAEEMKGGAE